MLKGARQGAGVTPILWNVVVSVIVYLCAAAWECTAPVGWCDGRGSGKSWSSGTRFSFGNVACGSSRKAVRSLGLVMSTLGRILSSTCTCAGAVWSYAWPRAEEDHFCSWDHHRRIR